MRASDINRPRSGVAFRRRGLSAKTPLTGDFSMRQKLTRRRPARNDLNLDLFTRADSVRRCPWARSRAGREIQRRGAYPPSTATLYARLAGLHVEDE